MTNENTAETAIQIEESLMATLQLIGTLADQVSQGL